MAKKLEMVPDWRRVLNKAWSIKFNILAALICGAEVAVQIMATVRPTPYLAMVAGVISLLATLARLVRQPRMHDE